MNSTMMSEQLQAVEQGQQIDALSIYQAFAQVRDQRHKPGVRYSVQFVLTLLLLGKLAGMTTPAAIADWVRQRAEWLRQVLPTSRASFPCAATYGNVLRAVQAEEVTQVIAQWLTRLAAVQRCADEASRLLNQPTPREPHVHVALDGKTWRGTLGHEAADQPSVHLVSLYEAQTGMVLAQQAVADKQNEISLEPALLTATQVKGRIITADAMHTQRPCCADITRFGGHYVLIAKEKQPELSEDLRLFLSEPPLACQDWRRAHTWNKGHGRLERRELIASTELNEFLAGRWPGISQVFRLQRTIERKGQVRQETVYGITSLSAPLADASRLLTRVRSHWSIANRLHWRGDVTLREDHCQVRKGQAPQVLAALNNTLLALLDFLGVPNVPKQMRFFDAHPDRAVQLLLGSLLTFT